MAVNPQAFVLMPFSSEFDEIYDFFIVGAMTEAGFSVSRADNILNQRNILEDVIRGIVEADIIVADLTTANPNVYYELGLAHALGKKVILIAQDIEEVPFDLRSYRIITYSPHFAKMQQARGELQAVAEGAFRGDVQFGSPVSDFGILVGGPASLAFPAGHLGTSTAGDDRGLLDYQSDLEDNMNTITKIVGEVGSRLSKMTPEFATATDRVTGVEAGSPKRQRATVRSLARRLDEYSSWLAPSNDEYKAALSIIASSLDGMLSGEFAVDESAKVELARFAKVLPEVELNIEASRNSFSALAKTIDALPRLEKEFNRAKRRMSQEIKTFVDNIDQTSAVLARTRNAAEALSAKNI
jgi:hypothetical protein